MEFIIFIDIDVQNMALQQENQEQKDQYLLNLI